MIRSALLMGAAGLALSPMPAAAEDDLAGEVARLRAEVEALRAELRAMRPVAGTTAAAPADAAPQQVAVAAPAKPAKPAGLARADEDIRITWRGAPEFSTSSGWSFKPRGRLQFDAGYLAGPASRDSGVSDGRGLTTELRRGFFGAQGTIPGGFTYRTEIDFGSGSVDWNDVYLTYGEGPVSVTVGQHHNFQSLERLVSDLNTSFMERAAFNDAFNFERRVGVSVQYMKRDVVANAGVFTDDINALSADGNKSFSVDGRMVWMPRWGKTQLHFGGSAHWRHVGNLLEITGSRYRQRPYLHSTDLRYIDTGIISVDREISYGAEFAMIRGRVHVTGEGALLRLVLPQNDNATFYGGYAEVGYFLTAGDTRGYRGGMFDRINPAHPLDKGGIGAIQVNLRYDHLDLTSSYLRGGEQDAYGVSLVWVPVSSLRFVANYIHLDYQDAAIGPADFGADTVAVRAQLEF